VSDPGIKVEVRKSSMVDTQPVTDQDIRMARRNVVLAKKVETKAAATSGTGSSKVNISVALP